MKKTITKNLGSDQKSLVSSWVDASSSHIKGCCSNRSICICINSAGEESTPRPDCAETPAEVNQ